MMSVTVQGLHFSAGHRIPGLIGPAAKCANLHGHTFTVAATWEQASELAVEFTAAKRILRQLLDKVFDHGYIVGRDDNVLLPILVANNWKHYVTPTWPTTEVIAAEIAALLQLHMPGTRLWSVEVQEGPNNAATWSLDHVAEVRTSNDGSTFGANARV